MTNLQYILGNDSDPASYEMLHLACISGRSGLAIACLTAVREVLGSNRAVGSCVYCKNHCDLLCAA